MSHHGSAFGSTNADPRNIVILLDGTGNQFSAKNSNVIKTMSVLDADEQQLLFYSSGVGTVLPDSASRWGKIKQTVAEMTDLALAWNFEEFVCDAYKFLMDYYRTGDRVYIFGFSRGAWTARVLAGMVQKVGLLPPGNHNQIKLAYEVYAAPEKQQAKSGLDTTQVSLATQYRNIFGISRPVSIHFIGVWDTVSSLGGLDLPRLPFATGVRAVSFYRQALALDERRARFAPEYRRLNYDESRPELLDIAQTAVKVAKAVQMVRGKEKPEVMEQAKEILQSAMAPKYPHVTAFHPFPDAAFPLYLRKNVECWFIGCHSDIGGGNDPNHEISLSNVAFRWMLREAVQCGVRLDACGLVLQPAISGLPPVKECGLIPDRFRQLLSQETCGQVTEQDVDSEIRSLLKDHLQPGVLNRIVELAAKYDTSDDYKISEDLLRVPKESLTFLWRPIEFLYMQTRSYAGSEDSQYDNVWRMNLGQGRQMVPGQSIHRSVLKRLQYDASWQPNEPTHRGEKKYAGPSAHLPAAWQTTWGKLLQGDLPEVWEF